VIINNVRKYVPTIVAIRVGDIILVFICSTIVEKIRKKKK